MDAYDTNQKWMAKLLNMRDTLSREEENELTHRYYVLGERKAGEELILAHQKLVMKIALPYARQTRGVRLDDLFSEGTLGLLHALKKYEPARGNRFMAYAKWWIRSYVRRHALQNGKIVRTYTTLKLRDMFAKFRTAQYQIENDIIEKFGESPLHHRDEIERRMAELFDVPVEKIREFEGAGKSISIDTIGLDPDETGKPQGYIPQDEGVDYVESQTKDTLAKILREEIETLKPIQRDIIKRRFSIGFAAGYHDKETFAEIGLHYNMSGETIRQIEARGLRKLRDKLKGRLSKAALEELVQ